MFTLSLMADAAFRQVLMLRRIPPEPRKITIAELVSYLRDQEGIETTARTIQRDLITLSQAFGLVCDQRSKPYGWSFRHGGAVGVAVMDMGTALALELASQYLSETLPKALLKGLEPQMTLARKRLSSQPQGAGRQLVVWDQGGAKYPAKPHNPQYLDLAYQAIHEARGIDVDWGEGRHCCQPIGLVYRGRVPFLVACLATGKGVRQIALHRVRHIKLLGSFARSTPSISLAAHLNIREEWVIREPHPAYR